SRTNNAQGRRQVPQDQEGLSQEGRQDRHQESRVSRQEGRQGQARQEGPECAQERSVRLHAMAEGQPISHHQARHVCHRCVQAGRSRMERRQGQDQVGEGCSRGQEEIREGEGRVHGRSFPRQEDRQEDRQEVNTPALTRPFPGSGPISRLPHFPSHTQLRVISLDPY
ncbi:hypothetical protein PENTCL1PPCAC_18103, partial [Pristionchus entomophagus]